MSITSVQCQRRFIADHIEFDLGKNTDRAVNDVRDRGHQDPFRSAGGIQEPVISRVDGIGTPIVTYAVASKTFSDEQLSG